MRRSTVILLRRGTPGLILEHEHLQRLVLYTQFVAHGFDVLSVPLELEHGLVPMLGFCAGLRRETVQNLDITFRHQGTADKEEESMAFWSSCSLAPEFKQGANYAFKALPIPLM